MNTSFFHDFITDLLFDCACTTQECDLIHSFCGIESAQIETLDNFYL